MPRLKLTYPPAQVVHLWAAFNRGDNAQDRAHSPMERGSRAVSFNGVTLFWRDTPAAIQCRTPHGRPFVVTDAVIGDGRSYPGQRARDALAEGNGRLIDRVFWSDGPSGVSLALAGDWTGLVRAIMRMGNASGCDACSWADAHWLCRQFGLDWAALVVEYSARAEGLAEAGEARRIDRARGLERQRERREESDRLERSERAWGHAFNLFPALNWMAGGTVAYFGAPTLIRPSGDGLTLITSRGARFPTSDALRALPFIERIARSGREWSRVQFSPDQPEETRLGAFRLDAIQHRRAGVDIVAGCHTVPLWAALWVAEALADPAASALDTATRARDRYLDVIAARDAAPCAEGAADEA